MFNESDYRQIKEKGISLDTIEIQLENFRKGFPFVRLNKPALVPEGIISLSPSETRELSDYFDQHSGHYSIMKFVPASGAASRMFKDLYSFLEWYKAGEEDKSRFSTDDECKTVVRLVNNLIRFPFYKELKEAMLRDSLDLDHCLDREEYHTIIEYLITEKGLNYGNLPKGLLLFHMYPDGPRTPIEEHLAEGAEYSRNKHGKVKIHFSLSAEHIAAFTKHISKAKERMEALLTVSFEISYSIQQSSTDTLAVGMDNQPFREKDGTLVFRPGGHGALIENLNELEDEIIFIKNIDNIVPDRLKSETYLYKKALAGLLMKTRHGIFSYLQQLSVSTHDTLIDEIVRFAQDTLFIRFDPGFEQLASDKKKEVLLHRLNRPVRICGMVKNEGEPGGGPFWITDTDGELSLQIVESSQVDLDDPGQKAVMAAATHFNPVDLVCSVYDYTGQKFNLHSFIDPTTGFISVKSKDGRKLKAQELPGLWNGAMAHWITIFVEIPLITFNPVKVVNDLLRDTHQ